jgi:hypothetical protein
MEAMTVRHWLALTAILILTAAIYVSAGLPGAYLAADDFQWLGGGHTFTWGRLLYVTGGDRFYRPAADLWFAATTSVCGFTLPCHHLLLLGVHLANVVLVFLLATWLSGSLRTSWLATLLFALNPAYTQAVVWLSAITGVLCAFGYLGSLTAIAWSWHTADEGSRRRRELAAIGLFGLAAFSHEAAITLPLVAFAMWWLFGPSRESARWRLSIGVGGVVVAFAAATVMANRRNALFATSGYRLGLHSIDHALDYVASLYVGPSSPAAHVFIVAALVALLWISRTTRFGALWLLITMLPYLPFTTGNTSRYAYLPAIGFSWATAGAIVAGVDRLRRAPRVPAWTSALVYAIASAFVVARFVPFAHASVRGHVRAFEEWRLKVEKLSAAAELHDGTLQVAAPDDPLIDSMYIEPIVQWQRRDYETPVKSARTGK